jgi:beta-lactamase class C
MKIKAMNLAAATLWALGTAAAVSHAVDTPQPRIKRAVDQSIRPLMAQYSIPGVAVGVIVDGKPSVFTYGVASRETGQPVTPDTSFEIGSISKTFTATLASYAQVTGHLSLSDATSKYLPGLQKSPFGKVSLLNLGTHTPGGLPLQVPDNITNDDQLLSYFRDWKPTAPPGTVRTYSNIGIGTLGWITAKSMGQDFDQLMEQRLLPAFGIRSSYIHVPPGKMPNYAQGYTKQGAPIRMTVGELSSEAYGIKATAPDMLRFMAANMNLAGSNSKSDSDFERALIATHTGYFHDGPMTQDLIWEQYPYPVALPSLLDGNSPGMALNPTSVTAIHPPEPPRQDVWINKTGSTNGFGAYVAFIPEKRLGIVILANRNYPIDARVTAAYSILTTLANEKSGHGQ